jgi:NTE family protein
MTGSIMGAPSTSRQWLATEPFTLVLSAGFFGFFSHTGLLLALEEAGLRPRRVVGVSAGALAGGLWACGVPAERLGHRLSSLTRAEFWDPGLPIGGLLRGRRFAGLLDELLEPYGVRNLEDAPTPACAVVWDLGKRRLRAVQRGSAQTAIRASCALPGLFRPVRLDGRWVVDGGVGDRAGTTALAPGERALIAVLPHESPWPEVGFEPSLCDGPGRRLFTPRDLPRVNPFALHRGAQALDATRAQFRRWLDQPDA